MASSFLTYHGTFLCFGEAGTEFRHVPIDRLEGAALVLCEAEAAWLRSGGDHPVSIRPASAARVGLPRVLGVGPGNRASTISLEWRDAHLCAVDEGGAVMRTDRVEAWEEFLPIASEDVALLRALFETGWENVRDRRRLGRGEVRPLPDFLLRAGDAVVDLRLMPSLDGSRALREGRASLLVDGWRIEAIRRYQPLVVWRHDGSEAADEEIVLGLRSLLERGGFAGRTLIETRLKREELLDMVPGLRGLDFEVMDRAEGRRRLLPWPLVAGPASPVLYLANGIACRTTIEPLLRALAEEDEVALLPWVWNAGQTETDADTSFFCHDPAESSGALACSAAIVGSPNPDRSDRLHRLISTIAANRLARATVTDQIEDDLLRYVIAREGGGNTRLLSRHAASAGNRAALLNFRSLPAGVRAEAIRDALLEATA